MDIEKKKQKQKAKKEQKCKLAYENVAPSLGLSELDQEDKLYKIIEKAVEVKSEIFEHKSHITEDGVNVSKLVNPNVTSIDNEENGIPKAEWNEFVKLAYKRTTPSGITEKMRDKYEQQLAKSQFITNLKASFFDSHIQNDSEPLIAENTSVNNALPKITTFTSSEFEKNLADAVEHKEKISLSLMPEYNQLVEAAMYVSDFKLSKGDIEMIVEVHLEDKLYTQDPDKKPLLWGIIEKFCKIRELLTTWGFDLWINTLDNFSISISYKDPLYNDHDWVGKKKDEENS